MPRGIVTWLFHVVVYAADRAEPCLKLLMALHLNVPLLAASSSTLALPSRAQVAVQDKLHHPAHTCPLTTRPHAGALLSAMLSTPRR
jgi:hypothetical protein